MVKAGVVKLVVTGPVNAGKSTLIRSLSDVPVVCTNEQASDDVLAMKDQTTVAMDHGIYSPAAGMSVHLYGTPGQRRFDFMWEILTEGADGIVFLADASDPASIAELGYIFEHFQQRYTLPFVLGLSRYDAEAAASLKAVAEQINIDPAFVCACDPRSRQASEAMLSGLLERHGLCAGGVAVLA